MSHLVIKYLSHGAYQTGGLIYEQQFTEKLAEQLTKAGIESEVQHLHKQGIFRGYRNFGLFFSGFMAGGDINVVVFRLALAAMLRNLFNKKIVLAVIHNYDPADYKSSLLRIYCWKFFILLKLFHPSGFAIVTVAPYWQEYFSKKFRHTSVFFYPNLFENKFYKQFSAEIKKKKIHLGQYSTKNDPAIFGLADRLTAAGYECYFTSLRPEEVSVTPTYSIKYGSFEDYLKEMAESEYTLALTGVNEGWNRIAHESLLVNTPVIGYARGGLGNLLYGSGAIIVHNVDEAFESILKKEKGNNRNKEFLNYFDISKSGGYFQNLMLWLIHGKDREFKQEIHVSVVMPVFNSSVYLPDAIESILSQSYQNFEFIIVNDGSTDHSEEIVLSYHDNRIKYIRLEQNYGNACARNLGLQNASGKYVMIQDSDDMSLPDRMKIQVEYMESHPWVGVCGSYMKVIEKDKEYYRKYPTDAGIIRACLFSKNMVAQPTVMIRKEVFDIYNLKHLKYYEDFNLWYQASKVTAIVNIPRVLVHYRLFDSGQKLNHRLIKEYVVQLIFRQKLSELNIHIPEAEFIDFAAFMKGYIAIDSKKYKQYSQWLKLIEKSNKVLKIYPQKEFRACLLYDRLRLWKFYFKSDKKSACLTSGGLSCKILSNFDCWFVLIRNF